MDTNIGGDVEPGWDAVRDAFVANFVDHGEVGAAVCVYLDGRPVADLWGGVADTTTGRPWDEDTVVVVFSCTKGVTAIAVNLLVERGLLDPDATVASYWPEFAAAGKGRVTVGDAMAHRAGVPLVDGDFSLEETLAWDPIVDALARQEPVWAPGTKHGYHMRTYGWIAGELIRRAAGTRPGAFLRDEVLAPADVDFWVGLPEEQEHRVARLVPPATSVMELLSQFGDTLLLARVFDNPGHRFDYDDMWNTRQLHAAELLSSNGIGNARSLARLYASCIGDGLGGHRTLAADTVARATEVRSEGPDAVIMVPSRFGLGFMLGDSFCPSNPTTAFGHGGAGGSLAFADPASGLSVAYVMNDLRFDGADPRADSLVRAAVGCLG